MTRVRDIVLADETRLRILKEASGKPKTGFAQLSENGKAEVHERTNSLSIWESHPPRLSDGPDCGSLEALRHLPATRACLALLACLVVTAAGACATFIRQVFVFARATLPDR